MPELSCDEVVIVHRVVADGFWVRDFVVMALGEIGIFCAALRCLHPRFRRHLLLTVKRSNIP
ncbi:hypothetical protein AB5I41_31450 [Sphingomonas sp. MMS24-JH45]